MRPASEIESKIQRLNLCSTVVLKYITLAGGSRVGPSLCWCTEITLLLFPASRNIDNFLKGLSSNDALRLFLIPFAPSLGGGEAGGPRRRQGGRNRESSFDSSKSEQRRGLSHHGETTNQRSQIRPFLLQLGMTLSLAAQGGRRRRGSRRSSSRRGGGGGRARRCTSGGASPSGG